MGTYLKMFNLFKQDCLILDIKLARQNALKTSTITHEDYNNYLIAFKNITDLEDVFIDRQEKVHLVTEAIAINIIKTPLMYIFNIISDLAY